MPTYSWEAFLEACKLVAKGDHNFKTIVIDTVDNAFKMCSDYVCAKHGIEYEGDMGHGKGWALVKNEWHRVLTRLASLPYGLIMISHAIDIDWDFKSDQTENAMAVEFIDGNQAKLR